MTHFFFPEKVLILLLILLLSACQPKHKIETILSLKQTEVSPEKLRQLKHELQARFTRLDIKETQVELLGDSQLQVTSRIKNTDNQSMEEYNALFGSHKLGFWYVYRPDDDEILLLLGAMEQIEGFEIFNPHSYPSGIIGKAKNKNHLLTIESALYDLIPENMPVKLLWKKQEDRTSAAEKVYSLYFINTKGMERASLTEQDVLEAEGQQNPYTGSYVVSLQFTENGTRKWAAMTREAATDNQRPIAIVFDGLIMSVPSVMEPITGGKSLITSFQTLEEAHLCARQMLRGRLSYPLEIETQVIIQIGNEK